MKTNFLYRGVSLMSHLKGTGLKPKETSIKRQLQHGQKYANHGSGIVHGNSMTNAVIAHQYDSSKYPTSAVSTSLDIEIAEKYAKGKNTTEGKIYKIDCNKLELYDIEMIKVSELMERPRFPEDKEVLLRKKDNGVIPMEIVIEIIEVK